MPTTETLVAFKPLRRRLRSKRGTSITHDPAVGAHFTWRFALTTIQSNLYLSGSGHTPTALLRALQGEKPLPRCILLRHLASPAWRTFYPKPMCWPPRPCPRREGTKPRLAEARLVFGFMGRTQGPRTRRTATAAEGPPTHGMHHTGHRHAEPGRRKKGQAAAPSPVWRAYLQLYQRRHGTRRPATFAPFLLSTYRHHNGGTRPSPSNRGPPAMAAVLEAPWSTAATPPHPPLSAATVQAVQPQLARCMLC